jgi:hypothetical protein
MLPLKKRPASVAKDCLIKSHLLVIFFSFNFLSCKKRVKKILYILGGYAEAVLKFVKLNTAAQQREAVVQGRSLLPYPASV